MIRCIAEVEVGVRLQTKGPSACQSDGERHGTMAPRRRRAISSHDICLLA
jgi:hypothetical protein